ncbi:hypothetical protein Moror_1848 [Moniliophthora roreri MCA 2997]|uniref:Uncharacterized protein n=2 Tax=Moniliophthora roreri TaxID=221103 RepID=V2X1N6_MONRO|nr:hypothetical protein Moror_1848 [Moniliophthora roreri MCA 2997]
MSSTLITKPNHLEDVRNHISRILNFIEQNEVGADCVVKLEVGDEEVVGHLCLKDDGETVIFDTRDNASVAMERPEESRHSVDNMNEDNHGSDGAGHDSTSAPGQNILDGQNLVSEPEDMDLDAQNGALGESPRMEEIIYQSGNSRFITRSTGFGNIVHNGQNIGFDSEETFTRRQTRRAVDGTTEVAYRSGNSTFITRSTPGRGNIDLDSDSDSDSESISTSTTHSGDGRSLAEQQRQGQMMIQSFPRHLEGRSRFLDGYHDRLVKWQAELYYQQRIFNDRHFNDQERLREEWRRLQNAWGSFQTRTMQPRRNEEGNMETEPEQNHPESSGVANGELQNHTPGATIRKEGNTMYITTTRSGTVVNVGTTYYGPNGVVRISDGVYEPGEDGREIVNVDTHGPRAMGDSVE